MKKDKHLKIGTLLTITILLTAGLTGYAYAKKSKGSPCYTLSSDYEVGKYGGNLNIKGEGGEIYIESGRKEYRIRNLTSFEETKGVGSYYSGKG